MRATYDTLVLLEKQEALRESEVIMPVPPLETERLLTIMSALVAIFQLKDSKVALSLATLFLWLIVALTAATFQALWNSDDLYKVGPFVEPRAGLVKKQA